LLFQLMIFISYDIILYTQLFIHYMKPHVMNIIEFIKMKCKEYYYSKNKLPITDIIDEIKQHTIKYYRRSIRIFKIAQISKPTQIKKCNIKFNDYIPIFIYSHAEYAMDTKCKIAYPSSNPDTTFCDNFKSLKTIDEYFIDVPKDTIIIDPIKHGYLCSSCNEIDYKFPEIIMENTLKSWFLPKALKMYDIKDDDEYSVIRDLYNNTKLYYPGDKFNNFEISFDKHNDDEIPWVIRIPDENGDLKDSLYEWSRHYSCVKGRKNSNNIYLSELLKKINKDIRPLYENKKLALIFVSCRPYPKMEKLAKYGIDVDDILLRYKSIIETGIKNTKQYRDCNNMILRPNSRYSAYEYDYSTYDSSSEMQSETSTEYSEAEEYIESQTKTYNKSCNKREYYDYVQEIQDRTFNAQQKLGYRDEKKFKLNAYEKWSVGKITDYELEKRIYSKFNVL